MRLAEQVAIVTGAASGSGRGIAMRFAKEGAHVVCVDRDEKGVDRIGRSLSEQYRKSLAIAADIAREDEVTAMVERSVGELGRVDVLVNSAGLDQPLTPLAEMDIALWDRIMAVNLRGTFLCCRHVLPAMISAEQGAIVNIASDLGYVVVPGLGAYCASKGGVIQLTRALAAENGEHNIRVNAICPTMVDTPMAKRTLETHPTPEAWLAEIEAGIPLRRIGTVEDVAAATLFLASDEAKYITGICLPVDGGRTVEVVFGPEAP